MTVHSESIRYVPEEALAASSPKHPENGRARKAIEAAGVAKKIGKVYKSVKGKAPKVSD